MNALVIFDAFALAAYGHPGTTLAHRREGEGDLAASVLTITPPPASGRPGFDVRGATPHEALQRARVHILEQQDSVDAAERAVLEARLSERRANLSSKGEELAAVPV